MALAGTTLRRAFNLGLVTGLLYFAGTLYWITRVMVMYGDLTPWVAVLVNAALIAYLSLFPALFALIVRRIVVRHGPLAVMVAPAESVRRDRVYHQAARDPGSAAAG